MFEWLERCYTDRDTICYELQADRAYDFLRADPRYVSFLRKLGLQP